MPKLLKLSAGLLLSVLSSPSTTAAPLAHQFPTRTSASAVETESILGRSCRRGVHAQPKGPFGVYVFCDDAVGTNIAILYAEPGDPKFDQWTLTRRFWQDGPWSADVSALGWVPGRNLLVVATSEIYGTGVVYLLNLEKQTYLELGSPKDCGAAILALSATAVTLGLNDCEHANPSQVMKLKFPDDAKK